MKPEEELKLAAKQVAQEAHAPLLELIDTAEKRLIESFTARLLRDHTNMDGEQVKTVLGAVSGVRTLAAALRSAIKSGENHGS